MAQKVSIPVITITQAVVGIIQNIAKFRNFYEQTVAFMDSMEIESGLTGSQKKAAVLDKMKEILLGNNHKWEDWKANLSAFIDDIIESYNKFRKLFA